MPDPIMTPRAELLFAHAFGQHVRSLRAIRRLTQGALAESASVSADTVRRVEHGALHVSLDTIRKIGVGLGLSMTGLFESFEVGISEDRALTDLLRTRSDGEKQAAIRVLRALFDELDGLHG